jgi:hypothetical protein
MDQQLQVYTARKVQAFDVAKQNYEERTVATQNLALLFEKSVDLALEKNKMQPDQVIRSSFLPGHSLI